MSYQTKGKLNANLLCLFSAEEGHASSKMKPECAWRDSETIVRVGTWLGEWRKIERAWSLDYWGAWQGMPPLFYQPVAMRALNAAAEPIAPVREGDDPVWHIASGEDFRLDWLCKTVTENEGTRRAEGAHYEIRSAANGALLRSGPVASLPLLQTLLNDGSYVVYVQYTGIREGLRLPTGYVRDAQYNYLTQDGRGSHYNPVLFVGEVPADAEHPLNLLRLELIATNTNQDKREYSRYVTSEAAQNGEGGAIKIHVGAGSWSMAPGVFVTSSRALCELDFTAPVTLPEGDSPSTPVSVSFDPLAHVISQVITTRKDGIWGGKVLLGGARFSPDGARPSLWQWNEDDTATLLGSAPQACDPVCEEMLSTGLVTALQELEDGSIIMLTLCSRHRYEATGKIPESRLPRYPLSTGGEPGGRSMTAIGGGVGTRVFHTTEGGGEDENTVGVYNGTLDIQGDRITRAGGTVANVDGCLWRYRGKTFGVRIGKPDGRLQVSDYDGRWRNQSGYRRDWLALQRGVSVNGLNLAFGYEVGSQDGRVMRDDGSREKILECDYRLRMGFVTRHATSEYLQSFLAPARKVLGNTLDNAWSLIELDGSGENEDGEDDGVLPTPDPLDDLVDGDGRFWRVLRLAAFNPIHVVQVRDMLESLAFEAANADADETEIGVRLRVDSDAAIDDFSSYIWRPNLRRGFAFPVAAQSKVEMLVVTRAALAPEQLPFLASEV